MMSPLDRILARLETAGLGLGDPVPCVDWPGATQPGGYGHVSAGRRGASNVRVVRVLLEHHLGREIRPGMVVRHTCDRPQCCNPAHLVEGTKKQNSEDMVARGRSTRGERHGNASLTEDRVRAIRSDPRPYAEIAAEYQISRALVSMVKHRHRWGWLP